MPYQINRRMDGSQGHTTIPVPFPGGRALPPFPPHRGQSAPPPAPPARTPIGGYVSSRPPLPTTFPAGRALLPAGRALPPAWLGGTPNSESVSSRIPSLWYPTGGGAFLDAPPSGSPLCETVSFPRDPLPRGRETTWAAPHACQFSKLTEANFCSAILYLIYSTQPEQNKHMIHPRGVLSF